MKNKFIKLSTGTIVKIVSRYYPNEDGALYLIRYKNGKERTLYVDDKFTMINKKKHDSRTNY